MAFMVFKGEKKMAVLVGRAFGKLKASDAKRAEEALVRANPHLATLGDLEPGALIVIPLVPGLGRDVTRRPQAPAGTATSEARAQIVEYRAHLAGAARTEAAAVKALEDVLRSRELEAALKPQPDARPYVERVTDAAAQRSRRNDETLAWLEVASKADADLDELLDSLD